MIIILGSTVWVFLPTVRQIYMKSCDVLTDEHGDDLDHFDFCKPCLILSFRLSLTYLKNKYFNALDIFPACRLPLAFFVYHARLSLEKIEHAKSV
jgi:hypothetical protein